MEWAPPNARFFLNVKNESGKFDEWEFEAANPETLRKQGLSAATFAKGQTLTVNAYRATNGSRLASARMVTNKAGKQMQVCDPAEDGGPTK